MPNSRCIETGAREGVYLGSQLPVDALPGKAGQDRARFQIAAMVRGVVAGNGAFFMLFGGFFQNLYYYAETMGGQK